MKILIKIILLSALTVINISAQAEQYFTLYGVKIGQKLEHIQSHLGKATKVHNYDDGWKAYIYQLKGHNVFFETDNTRPDLIISIQIEGLTNPKNMGLKNIDLGMSSNDAIKEFGKPLEKRASTDSMTKAVIPNTFINYYKNFSFEEKNGNISSIKLIFTGSKNAPEQPNFHEFLSHAKSKDYYALSESLSNDFKLNGKYPITSPITNSIISNNTLNSFLFGKGGISSLSEENIQDISLRVFEAGDTPSLNTGYVYKLKGSKFHELIFIRSIEGWVLYQAF